MTDDAYEALRDAVNVARQWNVKTPKALRTHLADLGWSQEIIDEALQAWANYEKSKQR